MHLISRTHRFSAIKYFIAESSNKEFLPLIKLVYLVINELFLFGSQKFECICLIIVQYLRTVNSNYIRNLRGFNEECYKTLGTDGGS